MRYLLIFVFACGKPTKPQTHLIGDDNMAQAVRVASTDPSDGAVNVQPGSPLVVTYSGPAGDVAGASLDESGAALAQTGVNDDGNVVTYTLPSGLSPNTAYHVSFIAGGGMHFTTAALVPHLTATTPADNETMVAAAANVTLTFDKAIDPATVEIALSQGTCTLAWSDDHTLVCAHAPFVLGTVVTATLEAGAKDIDGLALDAHTWTFTIVPPPPPMLLDLSPPSARQGVGDVEFSITGMNLGLVTGITLTQGATTLTATNIVLHPSSATFTINVAHGLAGTFHIVLTNAGGSDDEEDAFVISTIGVDPINGNDGNPGTMAQRFKSLTHALSVAGDGDSIYLAAGTYSEPAETWPTPPGTWGPEPPNVVSSVNIIGAGAGQTFLSTNAGNTTALSVHGGAAAVSGITMQHFLRAVVVWGNANLEARHLDLSLNNQAFATANTATAQVYGSYFHDNSSDGMWLTATTQTDLYDTELKSNGHSGIYAQEDAAVRLHAGTTSHLNGGGTHAADHSGLWVDQTASAIIEEGASIYDNSGTGIYLTSTDALVMNGELRNNGGSACNPPDCAGLLINGPGADVAYGGTGDSNHGAGVAVVGTITGSNHRAVNLDGAHLTLEGVWWSTSGSPDHYDGIKLRNSSILQDSSFPAIRVDGPVVVVDLGHNAPDLGNNVLTGPSGHVLELNASQNIGTSSASSFNGVVPAPTSCVSPQCGHVKLGTGNTFSFE